MLIVNPEERATINNVVEYCEKQIEMLEEKLGMQKSQGKHTEAEQEVVDGGSPVKSKPTIDPCLIMDDIIEKL